MAVYSNRGNEDCFVLYEKRTHPCFFYGVAEFETTAGMMQDESVFSTPASGLLKVQNPSL